MPSTMHVVMVVLAGQSVRNILGGGGKGGVNVKSKMKQAAAQQIIMMR